LNHGYYAKDQYTVVFSGVLSFCNNKTGNIRGIRRGGKETYRTVFRPIQTISPVNALGRINSTSHRLKNRSNRKASIMAQIENFTTPMFTVNYSPEIFFIPSELVSYSEMFHSNSKPTPPKRAVSDRSFVLSPRIGLTTSRMDDQRRRFMSPSDRTPEMKTRSYFIPANKLMYPFRQVSRFWGSQRMRQPARASGGSTSSSTTVAKPKSQQTSLRQILENFANNQSDQEDLTFTQTPPADRRKIRSRSVPNLEALLNMNENENVDETKQWGRISARGITRGNTVRTRFGEYRSHYRPNTNTSEK